MGILATVERNLTPSLHDPLQGAAMGAFPGTNSRGGFEWRQALLRRTPESV